MGKTPKKAVPGGDERNLYVRRLKAATASSKASDTSLPERQRESENENRSKLSGVQKKLPGNTGKTFKSKLRSPSKSGVSRLPKLQGRLAAASSKEHKKLEPAYKAAKSMMSKLQKEAEESEVQLKVSIQKEDVKEQNPEIKTKEQISNKELEAEIRTSETSDHQKDSKDSDNSQSDAIIHEEKVAAPQNTENTSKPEESRTDEKNNDSTTTEEDQEGNNFSLNYVIDESSTNSEDDTTEKNNSQEEKQAIEIENGEKEMKESITEKDDNKSEALTDTESYSVDVVESTTSEVSEASELVTQTESDKVTEKSISVPLDDVSFVTYDSNIMLKDVKIKLNDCLKDNSKLFNTSNADNSVSEPPSKDASFGRTLRNISGRHSIGRLRHVTLRERRLSPNNSLFVNTSSTSLPAEEAYEQKLSNYRTVLSEKFNSNGSAMERKRKLELDACNKAKKIKTDEETSFLNSSIGLLRGWRRPIQVSTPNVGGYTFKPDKLNISGIDRRDDRISDDESGFTKNWCAIM